MEKTSTFLLRYDVKPGESIIGRSSEKPEWQLFLFNEKELYISELKKPSEFDVEKKVDPYEIFPGLPITNTEDLTKIQAFYAAEVKRILYEPILNEELKIEKRFNESSWFRKLFFIKRPDPQRYKVVLENLPEKTIQFKEARYNVIVEECKPPHNNIVLKSFYQKVAGLPEFMYWTVYWDLLPYERDILKELYEVAERTGTTIYSPNAPCIRKLFGFVEPIRRELDYESDYSIKEIFPNLPEIGREKKFIEKTYKFFIEKIDVKSQNLI